LRWDYSMAILWLFDTSNYQASNVWDTYGSYDGLLVRASTESAFHRQRAREQMIDARDHGKPVGVWPWAYPELEPRSHINNALANCDQSGVPYRCVFIDVEAEGVPPEWADPNHNVAWLGGAGEVIRERGKVPGIYTSRDNWRKLCANSPDCANDGWLLWDASWITGNPTEDTLRNGFGPYGGWSSRVVWQYRVRPDNIDLDVAVAELFEDVPLPPPPPVDEAVKLREQVEMLRIGYDDVGYKRLGEHMVKLAELGLTDAELVAIHTELRRIRQQALGE
jgi:hypothetical protein